LQETGGLLAVCGDCSWFPVIVQQQSTYVKPDILILGKSHYRVVQYPVSAVLANNNYHGSKIKLEQHGSLYGKPYCQ